ncbi:MAG: hypothetical protein FJ130_10670 [Deltaproteobacteria bacterium]|nr:hypothetical protein [Deltaproteobacteria bacterium]
MKVTSAIPKMRQNISGLIASSLIQYRYSPHPFVSLGEIACLLVAGGVICFFIHPWQMAQSKIQLTSEGCSVILANEKEDSDGK